MFRLSLILALICTTALAANDPRVVAETAVAAWEAQDGVALSAISHPEFKARCRMAHVFESPVLDASLKRRVLGEGSDQDVLVLFFQAIARLAPHPQKNVYTFVKTLPKGDMLIAVYEDQWISQATGKPYASFERKVLLKKEGDDWRYLWSVPASIYVDLNWDPTA